MPAPPVNANSAARPDPLASSSSRDSGTTDGSYHTALSLFPCCGTPTSAQGSNQNLLEREIEIIVVMGPTGAGKSTFIGAATGVDIKVGHGLVSCTQALQAVRCRDPVRGRDLLFVDTPGFDDTYRSDVEILEEIALGLKEAYKGGFKLSGILYLHRITDSRMTNSLTRNLNMFDKLCGRDALPNVIFVTTQWDQLKQDDETGITNERDLRDKYWRSFLHKGSQMLRFENTFSSAWSIVGALPSNPKPLKIQEEMVDQKKPLSETSAGLSLFSRLRRAARHVKRLIRRLDHLIRGTRTGTPNHDNPENNNREQELAAARARAVASLEEIECQSARLSRCTSKLSSSRSTNLLNN